MSKEKFTVKFAETQEEKMKTYAMRYRDMLLEYRSDLENTDGLDITPYDAFAKQAICIDNETGEVVGCYRIVTSDDLPAGQPFVCEEEFDITPLKATGERIAELSRAVIKREYRNSVVLMLLLRFIVCYIREQGFRFTIGEASFFGTDKQALRRELSYLKHYHASDCMGVVSRDKEQIEPIPKEELVAAEAKRSLPPLIRAYLAFGAAVSSDAFADHAFGSVDVFVLLDAQSYNEAYINRLLRL